MNCRTVHLLDLRDEILLILLKKLGSVDALYSLLNVNKRLDQMARSIDNTNSLNFSNILSNDQFSSMNNVQLDGFCNQILPQIHHNIAALTLDIFSMERILLACKYPNLTVIVLTNFLPDILLQRLRDITSSNLHTLLINVVTFDDCLWLLDGRLKQLRSFTVRVLKIRRSEMNNDSQKILSNLKEFSLTSCFYTNAYDCRILPLLRRMPNLETLTLCLDIIRSTVIDGLRLNEQLLIHIMNLNKFIFRICTVLRPSESNYLLTMNAIKNTFINWKYSSVNCCIDHFSDGYTYCHIYSTPFRMTHFMNLSNSFRGHHFLYVTSVVLYDTRSFEHDYFEWLS
ncbi:unnamed protein product [Adineta steineri]|uniref:F-box domain-containing protein n=2 Tax=Adineta steineri TaxID=433720 RepID=A0A814YQ09_9BILA|nr:unnamed protein product [Adineta steineri]